MSHKILAFVILMTNGIGFDRILTSKFPPLEVKPPKYIPWNGAMCPALSDRPLPLLSGQVVDIADARLISSPSLLLSWQFANLAKIKTEQLGLYKEGCERYTREIKIVYPQQRHL